MGISNSTSKPAEPASQEPAVPSVNLIDPREEPSDEQLSSLMTSMIACVRKRRAQAEAAQEPAVNGSGRKPSKD
jgi:hypothetical protein